MLQTEPQIGIEPMTARVIAAPSTPQRQRTVEDSTRDGGAARGETAPNRDRSGNQMATVCGWCHESHPITACPRGPRLSAASVLAFALGVGARLARGVA
jgi:cytochrome c553